MKRPRKTIIKFPGNSRPVVRQAKAADIEMLPVIRVEREPRSQRKRKGQSS